MPLYFHEMQPISLYGSITVEPLPRKQRMPLEKYNPVFQMLCFKSVNPDRSKRFSLLHAYPDWPWSTLSLLYSGYWCSFMRVKQLEQGVTTHPKLRKSRATRLLPLCAFMHFTCRPYPLPAGYFIYKSSIVCLCLFIYLLQPQ